MDSHNVRAVEIYWRARLISRIEIRIAQMKGFPPVTATVVPDV